MNGPTQRGKSVLTPMEVRRAFGSRIAKRRRELGWSQLELARRAGTGRPRLSRLESGQAAPGLRDLLHLRTALGMSFEELILGEPSPEAADTAAHRALRRLEKNLSPEQVLFVGLVLNSVAAQLAQDDGRLSEEGGE